MMGDDAMGARGLFTAVAASTATASSSPSRACAGVHRIITGPANRPYNRPSGSGGRSNSRSRPFLNGPGRPSARAWPEDQERRESPGAAAEASATQSRVSIFIMALVLAVLVLARGSVRRLRRRTRSDAQEQVCGEQICPRRSLSDAVRRRITAASRQGKALMRAVPRCCCFWLALQACREAVRYLLLLRTRRAGAPSAGFC